VIEKYTYRVIWSDEAEEHVGLCAEFPSLSWLDASQAGALRGIVDAVRHAVRDMQKAGERAGEPIPEPLATPRYSGQFKVRIPPQVHRRLSFEAAESKVSLNRLIGAKLAQG
jgi:predicted HicB family RNase H-like nuclease